jgi:hypothetical protein
MTLTALLLALVVTADARGADAGALRLPITSSSDDGAHSREHETMVSFIVRYVLWRSGCCVSDCYWLAHLLSMCVRWMRKRADRGFIRALGLNSCGASGTGGIKQAMWLNGGERH